jgi:hypothetical protein
MPELHNNTKHLFLLAARVDLSLLTDTECDSAVWAVPLRRPRWDLAQANTLEMEPFLLALHIC